MTGVEIVGTLLNGSAELLALVPAESISGGGVRDDAPLPWLLVRTVSIVERQTLKRAARVRQAERVSVTVRARSYQSQKDIVALVRRACAGFTGDMGGATGIGITTAGTGPDLRGPADSFEQAQDFRVDFESDA